MIPPTPAADGGSAADDARIAEALPAWGDARLVRRIGQGPGAVWLARLAGQRVAVRASRRSLLALEWELDLLDHLAEVGGFGLRVPAPIRTVEGRRHQAGVVVAAWLDGRAPQSKADWDAVAAALRSVHEATTDWPQRPGFAGCAELVRVRRSGDVDLDALPADVGDTCETALAALAEHEGAFPPRSAVHGDPAPANLRVVGHSVALLGWDATRVDHPGFDFAGLTLPPAQQPSGVVRRAALAHEAAAWWSIDPTEARRRIAELHRAQP